MGGKNASSLRAKRSTPAKPVAPPVKESAAPAAATPRKRMRASDFASKKPSARKRRRSRGGGSGSGVDAETDVDKLLHGLRDLVEGDGDGPTGLRAAVACAREAFERDESGSSSEEAGGPDTAPALNEKSVNVPTPRNTRRVSGAAQCKTPKKLINVANGTPANTTLVTPRIRKAVAVTPERTAGSLNKVRKSAKKDRSRKGDGERPGYKSKTASGHKADIEALKKDDPEFYKFLEENDATLLEFEDTDNDSSQSGGDEDDNDGGDGDADGGNDDSSGDDDDKGDGGDDGNDSDVDDGSGGGDDDGDEMTHLVSVKVHADHKLDSDEADGDEDGSALPEPDDSDVENEKEENGAVDDVGGYSDDDEDENEEDEEGAEAEAAAEAGISLNAGNSEAKGGEDEEMPGSVEEPEDKKNKKAVIVDMTYLRNIKEQLKSNRSCLKAAKDLLRLFRAGRDILPSQNTTLDKKAKMDKKKSRKGAQRVEFGEKEVGEMEDDQFADDGSFTSGKVKFVSAKAYQHAMNLAIVGVQDALDRMLGKPESRKDSYEVLVSKWDPSESNRWSNLQPVFRSYVFHMMSLCDSVVDAKTLRFLLKRLERLVPYTKEDKELLKKLIRSAVRVWSSDALHISEATRLRSYLLLSRLAHGPGNAEAVLRSSCSVYASKISAVCNPRTLPRIHFATTCIVELFGVDMGAAYTTAFANLREMAVALRAVLVSKDEKEEVERIHNWAYVNRLRLWSKVLGKYGGEDELQPLIYPFVQISLGVMRVHATPRTFPMRLHVASYLSDLVGEVGTFIPLTPHLLSLLRCSELHKKPAHGSGKPVEWRSVLRVSDEAIKTKPFLSGVVNGVVLQLAKYFATISKHVSFPELAHGAEVTLRKFSKQLQVSEWRTKVVDLVEKLQKTSEMIADARGKADFSPQGAVSPRGMLAMVPGLDREVKMPIQRFYEVECSRVAREESIRDEKVVAKRTRHSETERGSDSEDRTGTDGEPTPRLAKRARGQEKRIKPPPSIIEEGADEEDLVEELVLDSDESSEE